MPVKPRDALEQARMRRWWLARYSMDELVEIGAMIWPELELGVVVDRVEHGLRPGEGEPGKCLVASREEVFGPL